MRFVVSLSVFCLLSLNASGIYGNDRPNIVLIMADDMGYECLGCNGGTSYRTPNLDQLAKTGMRFRHCYSQPLCTPSRVKIMTGIYNVRNYEVFGVLPKSQTTFAQLMKKSGYKTCVVGKWQLRGDPRKFGFDEYCLWQMNRRPERYPNPGLEINGKQVDFTRGEYGPDVVCNYACDFIEKNKQKPFLVYYPMILTHCPFCPTPDSKDWDPKNKGSKTYKGNAKYFGDMMLYADKLVGRIVKKIDQLGLRDNTLIIFTGDNGTDKPVVSEMDGRKVPGHKGKMTDGGTRVPMIASWSKTIKAGTVTDTLVDFSDFLPTICQATKTEIPASLKIDGQSFLPQLQGKTGKPRKWIYVWYSRNGGVRGKQWVRNQRYKLYATGKFYDVKNDVMEKTPLKLDSLSADQRQTHTMLKKAIDQFKNARPDAVAAVGQKIIDRKKKKNKNKKSGR